MSNNLRIEFRTRNNVLWHAIFDTCRSVSEFCAKHDLQQTQVGAYLNLKESPYLAQKETKKVDGIDRATERPLRQPAQKLCDITGIGRADLFPPDLYSGLIPSAGVAEVDSRSVRGLSAAKSLALPASQERDRFERERRSALDVALSMLTPREAEVLRRYFGLDSDEHETFHAIADSLGLSSTRVQQIGLKALRKLRHPNRSKHIRPFKDAEMNVIE